MLLSTLNCDLCGGLCPTFNYVTGAALSEVDSGYPSSHGSYSVEITFFFLVKPLSPEQAP